MNAPPQRTRQLTCVVIIVTLTALVGLSAAHFKTSAAPAPFFAPPPAVITNSGTANDIIYNLPGGDGNNLAILEDDGVPGNGLSQLRSGNGSFDTVVFANPANTLTINASNDGEKITVNNMDSGFVAKINLKGGDSPDFKPSTFSKPVNAVKPSVSNTAACSTDKWPGMSEVLSALTAAY